MIAALLAATTRGHRRGPRRRQASRAQAPRARADRRLPRAGLPDPAARLTATCCSWSSAMARSASSRTARRSTGRSSTSAAGSRPRAPSRGCSAWPSPPTTRSPACSTSASPASAATCGSSSTGARPTRTCCADRESARNVLRIRENSSKHHGGMLVFGPDGDLYIGAGDGGPSYDPYDTAQARGKLLGKLLRIDPAQQGKHPYTVPKDNPFVGRHGRDEIYAYGLRNPWRFSFDRATGELSIGDVGQDRFEEVDIVPAGKAKGANFGWSAYEGFGKFKGGVPRRATVTAGARLPARPGLRGHRRLHRPRPPPRPAQRPPDRRPLRVRRLLHRQALLAAPPTGNRPAGNDHPIGLRVPLLTSFGEDRAGHIYVLSEKGPVYKLSATRHRRYGTGARGSGVRVRPRSEGSPRRCGPAGPSRPLHRCGCESPPPPAGRRSCRRRPRPYGRA